MGAGFWLLTFEDTACLKHIRIMRLKCVGLAPHAGPASSDTIFASGSTERNRTLQLRNAHISVGFVPARLV